MKQFSDFQKNHVRHCMVEPGTVAWIPPAHNELYISLDSFYCGLVLPFYSTVMVQESEKHIANTVIEEGRAYAEAQRADVRSQKFGQGLRSWLDGLSLAM